MHIKFTSDCCGAYLNNVAAYIELSSIQTDWQTVAATRSAEQVNY